MTDSQCIFKEKDIGLWGRLIMKEEWIMTPWYLTNWGHSLECRIALGMEIKKSGLELVLYDMIHLSGVVICIFEHTCLYKCASYPLVFVPRSAHIGFEGLPQF